MSGRVHPTYTIDAIAVELARKGIPTGIVDAEMTVEDHQDRVAVNSHEEQGMLVPSDRSDHPHAPDEVANPPARVRSGVWSARSLMGTSWHRHDHLTFRASRPQRDGMLERRRRTVRVARGRRDHADDSGHEEHDLAATVGAGHVRSAGRIEPSTRTHPGSIGVA